MNATLISTIGPPGCGKTTLATNLARALGGQFIAEPFANNPFLSDAYRGRAQARLPAQLQFLLLRVGQLDRHTWPAGGLFVSDYGFCQDRLFARAQLSSEEFALYDPIRERLEPHVHPPELLILLDVPETELLRRIAARGREFEQGITFDFLTDMRARYRQAAAEASCPVLRVENHTVDLRDPAAVAALAAEVRKQSGLSL